MAKRKFTIKAEWDLDWIGDISLDDALKIKVKQIESITETTDEHNNVIKVKNVRVVSRSIKQVGDKLHFDAIIKCDVIDEDDKAI